MNVSVATVWRCPTSPLTQDRPALANPVEMRAWTRSLTTTDRIGLIGRVQTQIPYGERVLVLRRSGAWAYVVVPDEPSPKDRRGYPGPIPVAQIASAHAFARAQNGQLALVTRPTAWLTVSGQRIELSYGTRLPLVSRSAHAVLVRTPRGQVGLDCSGLVELIYRAHGAAIPRDADAQAAAGTPVSLAALRPGDAGARRFVRT